MLSKNHNLNQLIKNQVGGKKAIPKDFINRLDRYFPLLSQQIGEIYPDIDLDPFLNKLINALTSSYLARPDALKKLDQHHEDYPKWFQSEKMIGGFCYVDLYANDLSGIRKQIPYFKSLGLTYLHLMPLFKIPEGNNDGGYAVSSYRDVNPQLGTMADLNVLAEELREAGICLVLDFIFNHTSNQHEWAKKCLEGVEGYEKFYLIYPDREMPDQFEAHAREIFPEEHPGVFTQLPDGRWVWTTFHDYQWDLNYANPDVFLAMACEMLFIANQGAMVLRMDAVAFLWKQLGTVCENLPEVHAIIQAFNTIAKITAPSLIFKSEAIVHPDDVNQYIANGECQISYNPLQMALLWSSLASREVNLLQQALASRHAIDYDCSWVNYVRSHDDVGWTFSDEDAIQFGIDGFMHRQFLNSFYLGNFEGSFAQGVAFQENIKNDDCRICGTTASLVGLGKGDADAIPRIMLLHSIIMSTGGIPLINLGDEVGVLNDHSYLDDPAKAEDSRWVHRVAKVESKYQQSNENKQSSEAKILGGIKQLITLRKQTKAFAGGKLKTFNLSNPSVLSYQKIYGQYSLYVLANFSEHTQQVILSETPITADHGWLDIVTHKALEIGEAINLAPYQFMWIQRK